VPRVLHPVARNSRSYDPIVCPDLIQVVPLMYIPVVVSRDASSPSPCPCPSAINPSHAPSEHHASPPHDESRLFVTSRRHLQHVTIVTRLTSATATLVCIRDECLRLTRPPTVYYHTSGAEDNQEPPWKHPRIGKPALSAVGAPSSQKPQALVCTMQAHIAATKVA
jgi:hypothetical protein